MVSLSLSNIHTAYVQTAIISHSIYTNTVVGGTHTQTIRHTLLCFGCSLLLFLYFSSFLNFLTLSLLWAFQTLPTMENCWKSATNNCPLQIEVSSSFLMLWKFRKFRIQIKQMLIIVFFFLMLDTVLYLNSVIVRDNFVLNSN